ncbi:2-succinyl-5-enolpyruvyl-6-hydroxy-3-cyclohexene-1-carboxylic-acid synthase [Nocardioides bizhenqiangii]|uniref:2-succinyl-5-enolpyruvyl-6-hydroxy-3-cyclohexene-1-carboxylate synthase n=1 Tax=Nocardioides bizhenqiangii TaxID=3095076 RepID=A0ABZ0ZSB3_9ACTN|nr:2-succinyl-5-enolpyruvyl-6-hydroxy-3-cyclohexene-1-carboxylic-acid synthase [Nocardioides sp. HM61]WQQ26985.1 2-succinyl-5-enolpyruvyl-6-hydroxy-3-cyclohexene-1-carboxylic-acid synthase [Nocardioides sp. HM61]
MSEISGVQLGAAVVARLLAAGVDEVVVCPGSRNAPLSMAAWAAGQAGEPLRLHTRIDERSAGFLALGLTKVFARAAVLCTSGTAVANLHPAVLEAAHAGVPMVVVTADRPARMRATGANQTTDQVGIFGLLIPTYDVAELADLDAIPWRQHGPLHVNVQLDAPLVPVDGPLEWPARSDAEGGEVVAHSSRRSSLSLPDGPVGDLRTVVVAGDDAGPTARMFAEAADWPLLAEPSSGARRGSNAIRTYRLLLGTALGSRIERVVVLGRPTLSRPVAQLLDRPDVEIRVVPGSGAWPFHRDGALGMPGIEKFDRGSGDWLKSWQDADRELSRRIDRLLAEEPALTPYDVAAAVSAALPAGSLLVVGASSPIRDLDIMEPAAPVGERRKVIANRGLSGIDGTISTAIGAALGRPESSRAIALMGDVTFLHDQNGLVLGPDEPRPDLTIVVANDDGGSIFSMLEQGAPQHAASFERLFGTPHGTDLASLCVGTRTSFLRVTSRPELEHALSSPNGGIEVVEAMIGRSDRRGLDARIRALASDLR